MKDLTEATPRRVLVIDDNRAIHHDFAKIFATRGRAARLADLAELESQIFAGTPELKRATPLQFDVSFASQGQEGAALVEAAVANGAPFSVAFVDMRMPPGWDGVKTIQRLWEIDPELQCVICTAFSDYSWEQILAELGVSDRLLLLRKPFDAAEVCQLACALTEKWNLARHAHLKLEQLRGMVAEQTENLARSEARYALAAAGANDGLWDWDLASDRVFYAPRWSGLLGLPGDEPVLASPARWLERVHPGDAALVRGALDALRTGEVEHVSFECRMRHEDGQDRWMLCRGASSRDEAGRPCRIAGSLSDVTNRKLAEAQLRHDALHDALTGLPNRALLHQQLERALARRAGAPGHRYAVLFVDLDRFKVINDSLGHVVGDALLVSIAIRLTGCLRKSGPIVAAGEARVFRLGGDEFVVLLEDLGDDADAAAIAGQLLECMTKPIEAGGHSLHVSLSVGIAVGHPGYRAVDEILRDADTALYQAKAQGRGRYSLFTEALHVSAVHRWRTEEDLRLAIERRELVLFYQPIVSLASGRVLHFEALMRWRHPTRGLLPPGEFIPVAEETGLIVQLGSWALGEACQQAHAWRQHGFEANIAVNVAGLQLSQATFIAEVESALRAAQVPAAALSLEITESVMMDPRAVATCTELAERGIRLHLDDFGTGYSSLSYLTRMPIHTLKIDRSFVSRMLAEPMSASIVQTVLTLAHGLGLDTVAEGIETACEADALRDLSCSAGQGYFWAKPMEAPAALEFWRSRQGPRSLAPRRAVRARI